MKKSETGPFKYWSWAPTAQQIILAVLSFSTLEPQADSFLEKQKRRMWRGETLSTSPVCSRETGRWEEVRMHRKLSSQIIGTFRSCSGSVVKNLSANAGNTGDAGSTPGLRNPWRRKWQPIPVFLPGEFHGQRAWWDTVHGVAKSQAQLSN